MSQPAYHFPEDLGNTREGGPESPRHGFQGDRAPTAGTPFLPSSLTVAISREAGSRGATIARRAAAKLGWQVYTQELLEYIAQEGNFRQGVLDNLSPAAAHWVEDQLERLRREANLDGHPSLLDLARMIVALAAQGGVILIGRGAGCMLPARSTLHVRVMAPLPDRVAYMSQWLRLTVEEAAEHVRQRDRRRAEFIDRHFHHLPSDNYYYDMLLNSSLLGEELCAELITRAAQAKLAALTGDSRP
jgi:cytidylate kinase